jgi:protein-histidine pros-kinase
MSLNTKFSIVTLALLVVGLGAVFGIFWNGIRENAKTEVVQQARLIAAEAVAVRTYTFNEIRPLLAAQSQTRFLPHTIPAFAAATTQRDLGKTFPGYSYKEAALNPTNPADRATAEEKEIIDSFRNGTAKGDSVIVTRDTAQGPILYVARPIKIVNQDCLSCHSTPAAAPPTMIDIYGPDNGFGWNMNEIIGAQIVAVPLQVPLDLARHAFTKLAGGILLIVIFVAVLVHQLIQFLVVTPVRKMTDLANDIGAGSLAGGEFPAKGHDEMSELARAFNRMRRQFVGGEETPKDG